MNKKPGIKTRRKGQAVFIFFVMGEAANIFKKTKG